MAILPGDKKPTRQVELATHGKNINAAGRTEQIHPLSADRLSTRIDAVGRTQFGEEDEETGRCKRKRYNGCGTTLTRYTADAFGARIRENETRYATGCRSHIIRLHIRCFSGISPRTQWGRVAALIYALFGIPIILLYLSAIGEGLSSGMRCLFRRLRPNRSPSGSTKNSNSSNSSVGSVSVPMSSKATVAELQKRSQQQSYHQSWNHGGTTIHDPCAYALNAHGLRGGMATNSKMHSQSVVPISICIMILICYITLGAVLFHKLQPWGVLESLYFCFTSLGTIGFGDLMPKGTVAQYAASAYIIIGMAVVAMCFSLIQTELIIWLKKFTIPESLPTSTEDLALVSVAMTPIKS
ncbi:uncharacterized protein LOC121591420 [Anopheles merus]|uniref:uncharacterized protein LOC121591420 n=1 Tax=Anopheles merus TaxID=30066 RepID=UPI001BE43A36|nr:uncharacterized protein LOC121591420 [Anopheles merus]